jgi:hypothetical protein
VAIAEGFPGQAVEIVIAEGARESTIGLGFNHFRQQAGPVVIGQSPDDFTLRGRGPNFRRPRQIVQDDPGLRLLGRSAARGGQFIPPRADFPGLSI